MRWWGRNRKLTIFPKLIAAFLLVIAPLYVLGLVMNRLGETSVRNELSKSQQSRVEFYLNALVLEKEHIIKLLQESAMDKSLQHYTFLNGAMTLLERNDAVMRIESNLRIIKNSSVYIKSAGAHILTLDRTLSTERSITDEIAEEYAAIESAYRELPYTGELPIIAWQDRLFIGLGFPESGYWTRKPSFALTVELDPEMIRGMLGKFADYERSGAALINPRRHWNVYSASDDTVRQTLTRFIERQYEQGKREGIESVRIGSETYLVTYQYSPTLGSYLSSYIPYDQLFGKIEWYRSLFWLLSAVSTAIIILYSYLIFRSIHRPLHKLIRAFRKVEDGQYQPTPLPQTGDEFVYLFRHFNTMVGKLKVLIHEVYEQRIRAQSSELKQLQSQINPHFLYNSFFILYRLAQINDNDSIARFSRYLGEYFQYITRSAADEVPLEAEINHARTYAEIQNIRFSNRIQCDFAELPDDCARLPVPRLFLQPIIENAYKYGLEDKRTGGKIAVEIERRNEAILISVEDNGSRLTDETLHKLRLELADQGPDVEYTGLLNVHRRLRLRFGNRSGITVTRGGMGGMKVVLTLQVEEP
ncbi:sensor histidine kinase [Paenibacillus hodogayensis]|uniref:Sensor histidine kinase n=1 Tax=Paenibacillus hodogayensis TaxID=279208 RepID=A0ABV5VY16_9BACL